MQQFSSDDMWLREFDLRLQDKLALRNDLLTDKHMYAATKILRKQFPDVQSLQSPLLSQTAFHSIQVDPSNLLKG